LVCVAHSPERFDKAEVTGSSPVSPIAEVPANRPLPARPSEQWRNNSRPRRVAGTPHTLCGVASVPLIVVGDLVQGVGFTRALRQAATMRREEVPEHPPLHRQAWALAVRQMERALVWMRLRKPRAHVANVAGAGTVRVSGSARPSVRRGGTPVDERLDAIEGDIDELRARQREGHEALHSRIDGVSEAAQAADEQREGERLRRLVRSLDREEAGVWIFLAGLAMTMLGAVV
jgi:hypothetical protein